MEETAQEMICTRAYWLGPGAPIGDGMHHSTTPFGILHHGLLFQERQADGHVYYIVRACVRGLMVRLLVVGNVKFMHIVHEDTLSHCIQNDFFLQYAK